MSKSCPLCNELVKDSLGIENPQKVRYFDKFPENFDQLNEIKHFSGQSPYALYQCPECKSYFLLTSHIEYDLYAEENMGLKKLCQITEEDAIEIMSPKVSEPRLVEFNTTGRCSKCQSSKVKKLREIDTADNVLVWCRCLDCDNEEFMDAYKIDE